jgi:hypothetical protein
MVSVPVSLCASQAPHRRLDAGKASVNPGNSMRAAAVSSTAQVRRRNRLTPRSASSAAI